MNTSIDSEMVSDNLTDYASFLRRLFAAIIDFFMLLVFNFFVTLVLPEVFTSSTISFLVGVGYFGYFESSEKQATLGKQVMNIKVIDTLGHRLSFGMAALRYVGRLVSAIMLFLGFIMMLFTEKKQTLHDKIVGSLVVNA